MVSARISTWWLARRVVGHADLQDGLILPLLFLQTHSVHLTARNEAETHSYNYAGLSTKLPSRAAAAAPFVPGSQHTSSAGPFSGGEALMSSSAMPFMPKGNAGGLQSLLQCWRGKSLHPCFRSSDGT